MSAAAPAGRGAPKKKKKAPVATAAPSATPSPVPLDCEAVKARLVAAGKACPKESRSAAAIPCSPGGHAKLLALDLTCTRASDPDQAKKSPLAAPLDAGSCRAVSLKDGSLLAEATVPDYQGCARELQAQLLAKQCAGGEKQVEYLFLRGTHDPYAFTVRCP